MKPLLKKAYDPEEFRQAGYRTIDQLTAYLKQVQKGSHMKVIDWGLPDNQFNKWENYFKNPGDFNEFVTGLLESSMHIHHPAYMGHQVSAPAPITAITDLVTSLLNNGMAIYEMGPAASAIEKWLTRQFCNKTGFGPESDGFLTSGGTLATLTALLAARQAKSKQNTWKKGNPGNLAVIVPGTAHYSVDRAIRIMGFGDEGIISVPVDKDFRVQTNYLPSLLSKSKEEGKEVIAVVANACSTATGTYDDLETIADFCKQENLWLHVDAAHGGGALFSEKYKHLMKGAADADSIIIDLHKMLMTPALATMVLFKKGKDAYQTFNQEAQYLWEKNEDPEWFNYAKRTFECTKLMMAAKFCSLIVSYGWEVIDENVTALYDLAREFVKMLNNMHEFEVAVRPMANIVCFRLRAAGKEEQNRLNSQIRLRLLEEGDFYIVQTVLNGDTWLRATLMNPFTTTVQLEKLLDRIITIAKDYY